MNEMIIEPIWYYNTTWDKTSTIKLNIKYIIK